MSNFWAEREAEAKIYWANIEKEYKNQEDKAVIRQILKDIKELKKKIEILEVRK